MKKEIRLRAAAANTGDKNDSEELLEFLMNNLPEVNFKKKRFPAGTVVNHSLDWLAIIGSTAALITISDVLWKAYKKFVFPKRCKDNRETAFLYLRIENEEKEFYQFSKSDFDNKKKFTAIFIKKSKKLMKLFTDSSE